MEIGIEMEILIKLFAAWIFFSSFSWIKEGFSKNPRAFVTMGYTGKKRILARVFHIVTGIGMLLGGSTIMFHNFNN